MKTKRFLSTLLLMACVLTGTTSAWAGEVTDVLNNAFTGGISGTTYKDWSNTGTSGAAYKGQSAGDKSSIQLRSKNSNSGVVTTTSGGKLKSITVKFNSGTGASAKLDVYASNTAYSAATDLYNSSTQGTKVTSFAMSSDAQTYNFTTDYEFIGFRSNSGALYLDEVDIVWTTEGGGGEGGDVDATAIELNKTELTLTVGKSETLTATLTPANATTAVTWSSSAPAVAKVENGKITAISEGTATITANAGEGINATCVVTVEPEAVIPAYIDVLNLTFTGVSSTSYVEWSGKTGSTGAVYAGNSAGGNSSIQLRSSNNNSGVVTTTSGGTVKKITVKFNSNTAATRKVDVYVSNSAYSAASDLYNSSTQGTKITSFNVDNGAEQSYSFTEDYTFIGFRSNNGALYLDEVDIEWSYGEVEATAISLNKMSTTLKVDKSETLVATLTPSNATTAVTWTSSNTAVAAVSNGKVTAIAEGKATITATAGTLKATCEVTVIANDGSAETDVLDLAFTGVTQGSSGQIIYKEWNGKKGTSGATYAGRSANSNDAISLRTTDKNEGVVVTNTVGNVTRFVVKFNNNTVNTRKMYLYGSNVAYTAASDLFDTEKQGTLLKTFLVSEGEQQELEIKESYKFIGFRSQDGAMYIDEVKIDWEIVPIKAIALDKYSLSIKMGQEEQLNALLTPTDATTEVAWSSSDPSVATVVNGKVKALYEGSATITVSAVGTTLSAACEVTVSTDVTAIELDESAVELEIGDKKQLTATRTPIDALMPVTWVSSDPMVATVENGLVTALSVGEATITASAGKDISTSCTVVVKTAKEPSVALVADKMSVLVNEAVTFSYTPIDMDDPQLEGLYYRFKGDDEYIKSSDMTLRFDEAGTFEIYARVQDGAKVYNSAVIEVAVNKKQDDTPPSSGEEDTYTYDMLSLKGQGNYFVTTLKTNVKLGEVTWYVEEAVNNFGYNAGYAGMQVGSSKTQNSSLVLSTKEVWGEEDNAFASKSNIKYITLWLNKEGIEATVTINDVAATLVSGTVATNSSAGSYNNTSALVFEPAASANVGKIGISLSVAAGAGYICAIQVTCETDPIPAVLTCIPEQDKAYVGMPVAFDFDLQQARHGEFMYLTYWKDGQESNKQYQSIPSLAFNEAGTYKVAITVSSSKGQITSDPVTITVSDRPAGTFLVRFLDYDGATLSTQLVEQGKGAVAPAVPAHAGMRFSGWDKSFAAVTADLIVTAQYKATSIFIQQETVYKTLPAAERFYDFTGNGKKGAADYNEDNKVVTFWDDYSTEFAKLNSFQATGDNDSPVWLEDINNNGVVDVATNEHTYIDQDGNYIEFEGLTTMNIDINNDGRLDLIGAVTNKKLVYYEQTSTGEFIKKEQVVQTYPEYMDSYDADLWAKATALQRSSSGFRSSVNTQYIKGLYNMYNTTTGVSTFTPNLAIDLNGDGFTDLVDMSQCLAFFNMGDGKWIYQLIANYLYIYPMDLTHDGMCDFVGIGYNYENLEIVKYQGNGKFEETKLYKGALDESLYFYDFNHDGHSDILFTVCGPLNTTNSTSYVQIMLNDGNGNFTKGADMQSFGTDFIQFNNCRDIDGDGFYDLIAIRGKMIMPSGVNSQYFSAGPVDVIMMQGKEDMTFAEPTVLYTFEMVNEIIDTYINIRRQATSRNRVNIEDLTGNGLLDMWFTYMPKRVDSTIIARNAALTAVARPTAPARPSLIYNDGFLTVNWEDGADAMTTVADLTYALRIGTTSGGSEIVHAHANADGSRRNFLDGNMRKEHSYTIDLRSYPISDIFVSVQTVNSNHIGSAWSAEASIRHNAVSANFELDEDNIPATGTVKASFAAMPNTYNRAWDLSGGVIESQEAGYIVISFPTPGVKNITMTVTAPDGTVAKQQHVVTVLPNGTGEASSAASPLNSFMKINRGVKSVSEYRAAADYNFDGMMDIFYSDAVYDGQADGTVAASTAAWNSSLDTYYGLFYDWTHDGYVDLVYMPKETTGTLECLPHNGTNDFTQDPQQVVSGNHPLSNTSALACIADFTHNGYPDYMLSTKGSIYTYEKGIYNTVAIDAPSAQAIINYARPVDFNHDGFLDMAGMKNANYEAFACLLNNGDGSFEEVDIPLDEAIPALDRFEVVDMDADGYLDIVGLSAQVGPFVCWNNQNESFSAPQCMSKSDDVETLAYHKAKIMTIGDINNDGYPDIVGDAYSREHELGFYAFYFGANRQVLTQGFLTRNLKNGTWNGTALQFSGSEARLFVAPSEQFLPLTGATNTKPAVPQNVRAVQTADGLLISWDAADDDHTPATAMRYNLAVRHREIAKGTAGAYVITPQNGLVEDAMPLPFQYYIESNRFFIPMKYLEPGRYDIRVQAIDGWNAAGNFSSQLLVDVESTPSFEAPTFICAGDEARFTYNGTLTSGTPAWDWDGGKAVGTGFGPYTVSWETPGIKTVTLTVNGETAKRTIEVEKVQVDVTMPDYMFSNSTYTLDIPAGYKTFWSALGSGNSIIVRNQESGIYSISLELTNENGCSQLIEKDITVLTKKDCPSINIVAPNADAHHVIYFNANASVFAKVRIMKETSVKDQFLEVATVDAADGSYTDLTSNANRRAERYAVIGVLDDGRESPMSKVHQTLHLTINRGINDGTWNLIWNKYIGADVVSYKILRGESADQMQELDALSSYNTSYTDELPDAGKPLYAIEFVLRSELANDAPRRSKKADDTFKGRSNVVNANEAQQIIYATALQIYSINELYSLTEEQPSLWFFAELLPANATYKEVNWTIDEGDDLCTVSADGVVTILSPNKGGTAVIRATAADGSGVTATANIDVAAIIDPENPDIPTDIEEVEVEEEKATPIKRAVKIFDPRTGTLYILAPDGAIYNAAGLRIK